MGEWKTYRLGEIVTIKGGKRLPKGVNLIKIRNSHPYIRIRDIGKTKTIELDSTYEYVDDDTQKTIARYIVQKGDILISIVGTIGLVGIVGKSLDSANLTENCVKLTNLRGVEKDFLFYFLKSEYGQNEINKGIVGAVQAKLPIKNIENIKISLPPLEEQQRIAGILGSLDDKIELNRRINANLEAQAQALFRSWFVDNETQNNNPGFFNDIIQTTLSGDWGQETPKGNYISEVYCIRGADIPDIKCGDKGKLPTRYILEKNLKNKKLSENDLVVEISGGSPTQSTGRICLITRALLDRLGKDVICTNFCRALKPIPDYSFFIYLYWQYLYNNNTMFSYENGTTGIKNLNITDFINKEPIIIPEKKKILEFNKVLQPIFDMIYKNGRESEYLSALRDTLLPKLMAGEITIE